VRVVQGARQVGKTSFLERLCGVPAVSLDDLKLRELARQDPAFFLEQISSRPQLIDEVQYAPELFPEIKKLVDDFRRKQRHDRKSDLPILFCLSGSNQTLLQGNVRESLAGRANFFRLHGLSVREIGRARPDHSPLDLLLTGGWPELHVRTELPFIPYINDYLATFIEKDIASSAGISKLRSFETALGLLAARTGHILNLSEVASQAGVDSTTLGSWISILEQNYILHILPPYSSNLSKRLIKSPKIYFIEPALAARLQGWQSREPMLLSPAAGHLFETLVLSEIIKTRDHGGHSWRIYFLRTRDGEEVDFLVERENGKTILIEAKLGTQSVKPIELGNELSKVVSGTHARWVVTPSGRQDGLRKISSHTEVIPIQELADRLEALE
jgi:predicted AAA+ superfamily ATPase